MDHDGFALHLEEEVVGGTRTTRTSVVFFLGSSSCGALGLGGRHGDRCIHVHTGIGDIGNFIVVEPEAEKHVVVGVGIDMILRDARISFGQL
jgi:hypothetical protein